jgi:hypothetical protein
MATGQEAACIRFVTTLQRCPAKINARAGPARAWILRCCQPQGLVLYYARQSINEEVDDDH